MHNEGLEGVKVVLETYMYMYMDVLLTKCEVKMVEIFLHVELRSVHVNSQKKNEAKIQPS